MLVLRITQSFSNCKDYIAPIYISKGITVTVHSVHSNTLRDAQRLQVSQNCISCNFDFAEYGL